MALALAARLRWADASEHLRRAAVLVRRYRYPLTLNDYVAVRGAQAAFDGDFERRPGGRSQRRTTKASTSTVGRPDVPTVTTLLDTLYYEE